MYDENDLRNDCLKAIKRSQKRARTGKLHLLVGFYRRMWRDANRETLDQQWAFATQTLLATFVVLSFIVGAILCIIFT